MSHLGRVEAGLGEGPVLGTPFPGLANCFQNESRLGMDLHNPVVGAVRHKQPAVCFLRSRHMNNLPGILEPVPRAGLCRTRHGHLCPRVFKVSLEVDERRSQKPPDTGHLALTDKLFKDLTPGSNDDQGGPAADPQLGPPGQPGVVDHRVEDPVPLDGVANVVVQPLRVELGAVHANHLWGQRKYKVRTFLL